MLLLSLLAGLAFSALLYRRAIRLDGDAGTAPETKVRANVDGKPVDSYVKP